MSEIQPDMLGGKTVPGSRLRRIRKTGKAPIARTGWADQPGSGPDGETCGSCTYCEAFHYRKRYYKCAARDGDHWKGGRATDIRPLDPACSKWAPSVNRSNQKAPTHEIDSVADGDPGSQGDGDRKEANAEQPRKRDNAGSGLRPVEASATERPASRPQRMTRDHLEGLQRVFEF